MTEPDRWIDARRSRTSAIDSTSATLISPAACAGDRGRFQRESASLHVADVFLGRRQDRVAEMRVLFHERRNEAVEEPQHVVADENLPIAVRSRSEACGGH